MKVRYKLILLALLALVVIRVFDWFGVSSDDFPAEYKMPQKQE
ncbi:hypothetical protein P6P90_06910 [Ectobacillus antri]|jgi:hypothetical protein|uniref:Uncharacterized protein n=1 Tax=Ectobacillus antri TaxID=2486280 RepID=A0ABT6H3T2_9BACI|nr:hypothetical protein [Ectobacillus antri]MDG4658059.1 hypothetical protein [Ectobacillus antri]MDG5753700.1 hypothetical protein [Ectobacillus antri]